MSRFTVLSCDPSSCGGRGMRPRCALALVGLTLSACVHYQPRPIAPAETIASLDNRALDDPGLRTFVLQNHAREAAVWPPTTWDLRSLTWAAIYFQPDLDVGRAEWRVAKAGIMTAGARPNPSLDFLTQYNVDSKAFGGTSPWTVGPTLSIPIETAGKRDYRIEQARHLAQAAHFNLVDTAWRVRSRVRARLLGLYPIEPLLRLQQDNQMNTVRLLQRRLGLGAASQPEVTQAIIAQNQLTLKLAETRKQLAENRVLFAAALGVPVAALDGIKLSLTAFDQVPAPDSLPPREVQRRALLNRPDVLAQLADYEASQSALQLEVAKQYPDLNVGPGYVFDAGESKWSLGLSLVLPVRNRNQGPIAEAEARRRLAADQFVGLQARAISEVDQALAGYRAAFQQLADANAVVAAQENNERSAEVLFKAGESDRLTLLAAQAERIAAELGRLNTLIQAQQALGALQDAVHQSLGDEASREPAIDSNPRDQDPQP